MIHRWRRRGWVILGIVCFITGCRGGGVGGSGGTPVTAATRPVEAGDEVMLADLGMRFLRVSPGREGFEYPAYFVLETEVTNSMYARYLADTGAKKGDRDVVIRIEKQRASQTRSTVDPMYSADNEDLLWPGGEPPPGKGDFPVTMVNPEQASAFCAWLTKRHGAGRGTFRLPTKTEWLIAAYGRARGYPWGDEADAARYLSAPYDTRDEMWLAESKALRAAALAESDFEYGPWPAARAAPGPEPVKARPAGRTPEGLYGMWGNVNELVIPDVRKANKFVVGLGAKWMGGGYDDVRPKPRQDYWGYTHSADVRTQSIGFRVVLDVSLGAGEFRPRLGQDAEAGGSIYGDVDEWPRESKWPAKK